MKENLTQFIIHNLPSYENIFNPNTDPALNPHQTFYIIQFLRTVDNINYITSNHILFSPLYTNSGAELIYYHLVDGLTKHIYSRRISSFGDCRFYQLKLNKNNDIFLSQRTVNKKYLTYYNDIKNYLFTELKKSPDLSYIKYHGIFIPDELVYTRD